MRGKVLPYVGARNGRVIDTMPTEFGYFGFYIDADSGLCARFWGPTEGWARRVAAELGAERLRRANG